MALDRLPAYVRKLRNAAGEPVYYWELPAWARPVKDEKTGALVPAMRNGKPMLLASEKLGSDLAEVHRKAQLLNAALTDWRKGAEESSMVRGSVEWLFQWYRKQARFTSKKAKTRADYGKLMDMLAARETKRGAPPFGKRRAADVDAAAADRLYEMLRANTGPRQASYAMQVCRLVWSWAARHHGVTVSPGSRKTRSWAWDSRALPPKATGRRHAQNTLHTAGRPSRWASSRWPPPPRCASKDANECLMPLAMSIRTRRTALRSFGKATGPDSRSRSFSPRPATR